MTKCNTLLITVLTLFFSATACAEKSPSSAATPQITKLQEQSYSQHTELLNQLSQRYPSYAQQPIIIVSISEQMLYQYSNHTLLASYPVSTATNGAGSKSGSGKTPLGAHRISHRYGANAKLGTIFKARQNTGKVAKIITDPIDIPADAVTTRVMWLDGLEPGKNKGGKVDSHSRYIYIHGTPEEGLIGSPASHGCVRMLNKDVISLFSQSPVNTLVYIQQ